ncbi:hypothetical protein OCAE111667_10285 [Occultella aeris]|uniref:Uncharacterized protein n=1 Tax=Occultella aeris TaxID=2761496 RepID=A0A7M4DNF3_9MICO|nr:hypothetical protein [Occultella aeris]VZO38966.1 hypothetical protein HALOF300_03683 [Occultella aeris]
MVTWVDVVGTVVLPGAALLFAVVGVWTAWSSFKQRKEADARGHWWHRARWATERAQDPRGSVALLGVNILRELQTSELAGDEEGRLAGVLWGAITGFPAEPSGLPSTTLAYDIFEAGGDRDE